MHAGRKPARWRQCRPQVLHTFSVVIECVFFHGRVGISSDSSLLYFSCSCHRCSPVAPVGSLFPGISAVIFMCLFSTSLKRSFCPPCFLLPSVSSPYKNALGILESNMRRTCPAQRNWDALMSASALGILAVLNTSYIRYSVLPVNP